MKKINIEPHYIIYGKAGNPNICPVCNKDTGGIGIKNIVSFYHKECWDKNTGVSNYGNKSK